MFCPNCGQERLSPDTTFCSRCGFLLTGTSELIRSGGLIPGAGESKQGFFNKLGKNRGFKKGLFMMLIALLAVPLATLLAIGLRWGPAIPIVTLLVLVVGGLLRMAYAIMFESPQEPGELASDNLTGSSHSPHALPPQQSIPATAYAAPQAGSWRDTNDLEPASVTESTTRLLEKEDRASQ